MFSVWLFIYVYKLGRSRDSTDGPSVWPFEIRSNFRSVTLHRIRRTLSEAPMAIRPFPCIVGYFSLHDVGDGTQVMSATRTRMEETVRLGDLVRSPRDVCPWLSNGTLDLTRGYHKIWPRAFVNQLYYSAFFIYFFFSRGRENFLNNWTCPIGVCGRLA